MKHSNGKSLLKKATHLFVGAMLTAVVWSFHAIAMAEVSRGSDPSFAIEKDELVLDGCGTKAQKQSRIDYLVKKYGNIEDIEKILERDNPKIIKKIQVAGAKGQVTYYIYSVLDDRWTWDAAYGVNFIARDGVLLRGTYVEGYVGG